MFYNARAFNSNLQNWNTAKLRGQGMDSMFRGASSFNSDLSRWDTAGVVVSAGACSGVGKSLTGWPLSRFMPRHLFVLPVDSFKLLPRCGAWRGSMAAVCCAANGAR